MKLSQVLQSIFIGLVLLGVFATMAQNTYGLTLMGISCFGLALLYFVQLSWTVIEDFSGTLKNDILGISEMLLLSLILMLFGFRIFYISIPYSDLVFIFLCALLIVNYLLITIRVTKVTRSENPTLARPIIFFYLSLLIFLLSMGSRIVNPSLSALIGVLGFIVSVPFLIQLFRRKQYDFSARTITLFQFIVSSGNKAGMLFLFFILSGIYVSLSTFKIIPSIGNAEKPPTYIELINKAETGKEKPVNGRYEHEIYKENLDKFLQRHGSKKVKE